MAKEKEKTTDKFRLGDHSNKTKVAEQFSNLYDHIQEQDVDNNTKGVLKALVDKFHEKFEANGKNQINNVAWINNAVHSVNQYL